jgi:hypothetical protein
MTTKAEAIAAAGLCLAEAELLLHTGTVEEAAHAAHRADGITLAEREAMIRELRAQTPAATSTPRVSPPVTNQQRSA